MPPVEDELIDDELDTEEIEDGEPTSPADPPPAKTEGKDDKRDAETKSLREIRSELAKLRDSVAERDRALEYWRGRAEGAKPTKKDEPEEDEIELKDDLVDAISSNDAKRVASALKGLGFVSQKDVQATIQNTRNSMTREAKLVQDFPAIADEKSEFYQATKKHYAELVADDPSLVNSPATLKTAAKLAKAELGEKAERENDRAARVSRQSGGRSTPRTASRDSKELSPQQQRIIENLRAAGANISEDGYRKRAESGVRMAGIRRGR